MDGIDPRTGGSSLERQEVTMSNADHTPADTSMMRIVHNALRRDLRRAHEVLDDSSPPDDEQRVAIAEHLRWMMDFLNAHHDSEDRALYPAMRERRPSCGPLLDAMHDDHLDVATSIADVETAADAYGRGDGHGERQRLLAAIQRLEDVLLPHLRREEDDAMPVASEVLTESDWKAIEQANNLDGKSNRQLAMEGHWLIDDVSPEDRDKVLHLVPPVPRFILVHGYARSYRRRKQACWGPRRGRRRVQKHGRVTVIDDVDRDALWEIVRDPTRVGEWSHECNEASWLDGATSAVPGARFRGKNKQGVFRWGRVCEVVSVDDHRIAWRTVPTLGYPDSTVWAIELRTADDGRTAVTQTFDAVRVPKVLDALYSTLIPAHRDRNDALAEDLRRLTALAPCGVGSDVTTPRAAEPLG
jgi:hemerythrin-like domain-containing protein